MMKTNERRVVSAVCCKQRHATPQGLTVMPGWWVDEHCAKREGEEWVGERMATNSTKTLSSGHAAQPSWHQRELLLVEDHPLFRGALEHLIRALVPTMQVTFASTLQESLFHLASGRRFSGIFLDLHLPDARRLDGLNSIRLASPDTPIIVVSALSQGVTEAHCLAAGAIGVIHKKTQQRDLITDLQHLLEKLTGTPERVVQFNQVGVVLEDSDLTRRQKEVARLIAQARTNAFIAQELGISEATVKAHITKIMRALGVTTRAEAIALLLKGKS